MHRFHKRIVYFFPVIVGLMVYLCPRNSPWGLFMVSVLLTLTNKISLERSSTDTSWLLRVCPPLFLPVIKMSVTHKLKFCSCWCFAVCFLLLCWHCKHCTAKTWPLLAAWTRWFFNNSHRAASQRWQTTNVHSVHRETPREEEKEEVLMLWLGISVRQHQCLLPGMQAVRLL